MLHFQFKYLFLLFFILIQTYVFGQTDSLKIEDSLKTYSFSKLVITGTKTSKKQSDNSIFVNVLDKKTLDNLQVCNLSDGLKFQSGLRVENDCQTCGYTQLRMNGLAGGYSQILINGRPIFSPLMSLYGLEQLPVNMIEKIEIVRGGGSSIYGSSAIAGTVNVITKLPTNNSFEVNMFNQLIDNKTNDLTINTNSSLVSASKKKGINLYTNFRTRGFYDANNDFFSEIPQLNNIALGSSIFFKPKDNQKLEVNLSYLNEYRMGGEMSNVPIERNEQAEERKHQIFMSSVDYQINFKKNASLILYSAFQKTQRAHYTGSFPDDSLSIIKHLKMPPFGFSNNETFQSGIQFNYKIKNLYKTNMVLTAGAEYLQDFINDKIETYQFLVNQKSKNFGLFIQSDWEIAPQFFILSGVRFDQHNFIKNSIINPRIALLYKRIKNIQLRLNYGEGFRAPQAFDTDLHIAFAGGGISRVQLDPNLKTEQSKSYNFSINYDKPSKSMIYGFTIDAFYTDLNNAFALNSIGTDSFGEVFFKTNNSGANVRGLTLETRLNIKRKIQFESGFTFQKSENMTKITYIDNVAEGRAFLRTPNIYGFSTLNLKLSSKFDLNMNYVFTGRMLAAHFGGAENFKNDSLVKTRAFSEIGFKLNYGITLKNKTNLDVYCGIKNILNAYQKDFDIGKNRDSNYVYGPALPRTIFVGIKWRIE